jgi:nucleoside phosphorylase
VIASQAVGLLRQIRNVWAVAIDVLVVAALDDELQALRKLLTLERHEQPFPYERGKHYDHDVAIIRSIGMGLVDAAITTTRALCHFRPRLVVMIGVCGAVAAKAKIGDVIVANPAFHYQFGAFDDGFLRHELKTIPLKDQLTEVADTFTAEAFDRLRSTFDSERELRPPKPSRMIIAPMACADLVVKDPRKIKEADEAERKTTGVDMESYAVMRTCRAINDVPCIIIKAVQDVMAEKTDDYRRYAVDLATAVLLGIMPRLVATT